MMPDETDRTVLQLEFLDGSDEFRERLLRDITP
jgi:hypothetical protein